VRVRLAEADAAPKVANALIERAIDLNRRINQQEVVEARDYIKSQLDEATARVDRLRGELVTLKQKAQVDALRKDAEGTLHARSGLLELQTAIENERAFLGRSEADLKQSQQLLTTRRTIDRDTALTEAARSQNPGASVLGLGLTDEQINTSYSDLQTQVSESRAKLAGLEGQRRLLVDELRLDRASLPVLAKLYEGDVAVSRLQTEYEMALKVYTDLSVRHEDARIRVGGRGAQLQFVDPAVAPARRVASGLTVSVAIAVLAGALVAGAGVLAHRLLARRAHA
jgi:uncharacterized protein involved in exopolysaccharide biosynthesis